MDAASAAPLEPEELDRVAETVDALTLGAQRLEGGEAGEPVAPVAFQRVVVAVDASPPTRRAVAWARHLGEAFDARVTVVHAMEPDAWVTYHSQAYGWANPQEALADRDKRGRRVVDGAREALSQTGVRVDTELEVGFPGEVIPRVAADRDADLVVVGHHASGVVERLFLGSVADAVREGWDASVLVANAKPPGRRVLMPVDGSRASKRAALTGLRLARAATAPATMLHVAPVARLAPSEAAEARLAESLERLRERVRGENLNLVREGGSPAERILSTSREGGYDLIAMGTRGLTGLAGAVLGSVSNRVVHGAEASVLLVPRGAP